MKTSLFSILLISIVFISCTSTKSVSTSAPEKSALADRLLWKISKSGQNDTSFLFGTFHLMCKEDIKFNELIEKGIQGSDNVYLEIDMDDPSMLLGMMKTLQMKDGKQLSDLLTADQYTKVGNYFKDSLGMPIDFLKNMKPMMVQAMLYPKLMNCKQTSGIEQEVMEIAKKHKKEILGLETLEFQSSVFDSIPYEKQAKSLYKSIDSLAHYRDEFKQMYDAYRAENLTAVAKMMDEADEDMGGRMDLLLNNRNKNWVEQLKNILPNQSIFMAVGAGHLPGEEGVIQLLRKEGYTVEPAY